MGKDQELIQAVKGEDVAAVMRIVGKAKLKPKRSGSSKKSPLNFQDPDGFSALHHAALNGNCHILSLLLSTNQVYPDIKDNKGMRPLHYAAWQGKIEPVEQLLRAGANPSEPSLGGVTPLHLSSQYGSYSVVEALLQYKADPFLEQNEGKTPLDLAAEFGRLKVAELLLGSCQALIHLDGHSRTGQKLHTPLHLAAKNGHSDVASVLLDHGIDINVETHNGTALHEAALAGKSEVVSLLINSGIDVLKKDSMGQTALDIVNKFTSNRAAADIKTLLRDAIGGSQAKAIKDFMRLHDRAALSFKAGDIINVIERNPDGRWKGSLKKGSNECIGYFPRDHVQLIRVSPSTSESNNYPGSPPPFPQSGFPIMPANTYQSIAPASPLSEQTKRYSTGSTASASSSGNWSNRGSTGPTVTSGMRPNHLPVGGVPDPPTTLPPAPPMGSAPYNGIGHEEFPPPPPEMLNNNHSPQGTMRYHNDIRSHSNTNTHSNYQSNASPKKMNYPVPPWLAGAKFSDESGVDMSSSSNENIERKYLKGTGTLPLSRVSPFNFGVFYNRPLKLSSAQSIESMTGSRDAMNALGPRRPHSDGVSASPGNSSPRTPQPLYPFSKGKDADRIYDWLRQQRLVEYTNNFTLAGYDMPTIAKMTPEDLTAIGVTKPAHRKRITAMISNLKEQDPLPKYIPGDVATWLRLLDLSQYYNTLIANDYGTMDKVAQITWEDLQEIGINRLGDEKKFTLAIKRLNYLKKHGGGEKIQSPSYPGSLNSDSGSPSPAASLEGHTNQMYPPPAQFAPSNRRPSPQLPQRQDENHLTVQRRSGGLRSSRESLASDASVGSAGSHGSHEQLRQHDPNARTNPATNQTINEGIESTYVPAMSSFRMPGQGAKKSASLHSLDETNGMSFSTFKQPQISQEEAARRHQVRSTESLDRLMAAQAMADRFKRNSLEGGSSIASSGSGSGEQPAVKLKKSLPPAPPKRTNSVSVHSKDNEQKTATIGRKKSLKKFREEMQLYRAEFDAEFGAGTFDGSASRIEGYATIKRTSKKIDPAARLQRSQSQEGDIFRGVPPAPVVPPTFPGQTQKMDGAFSMSHSTNQGGYHIQQNSNYQSTGVQLSNHGNPTRTNMNPPTSASGRDYAQSGHSGSFPQPQAFQPTSNNRPALNLDNPSIHYQSPSVPNYGQQRAIHTQQHQNGGVVNRMHGSQTGALHDQVPRTVSSLHSDRPNHQTTLTNTHGTSVPNKPVRTGVPLELHQPVNGSKFVCPPDNKSALPGAQVPVPQGTRHRKNSQDHVPGQSRKTSVSEQSTTSNDSGGSSGRRPSSIEMAWKNQQSMEDDTAPVIQSALTNPLENIWRPKSRHLVRKGSMDKQESISSGSEKSDSSSSEATQIRTDATFLQLKKQFLERDSQAPPAAYSTLNRSGKKPEPLTGNLRVQGFSDQDEYNQSPVAKHPPMEIPDVRAVPTAISNSDAGHKLVFPQPPPPLTTPAAVFDKPIPQHHEKPKDTLATPMSRRDDLQSRVEKIAAGRRDPSPTKGLSSFGNNPLHLHIADIPPAPDFAAPVPGRMSVSPTGSASSPPLPPPPPPLQSAMGGPTPLQLQSVMGGPPPPQSSIGGPPPPPPPPPPQVGLPKKDSSANNNNSQGILKPAGPKNRPPIKLMPDMSDLQRELQRRTSKTQISNSSVEEAIKRNQEQAKAKNATSPVAEIVSPTLRKLSKPSMTSKPNGGGTVEGSSVRQNQERPKNASQEVTSPALRKLSKPPATKKKPVAPPPTKPRSPVVAQELPRDDEKDVDIFSQDLDKMEMEDDVVESDGSSDMESGVSGFEKENTDTIKKQPTKTSPPRPTLPLSSNPTPPPLASKPKTVESPGASWEDNDDGMDTIKRRPQEERRVEEEEEKRDSLGEAMEKLEALLNSPDGELVMGDFGSPASTPEKRKVEQTCPDPQPVEPTKEDKTESAENMSAEEESKVFNDLESMFESLAMDLENMLQ